MRIVGRGLIAVAIGLSTFACKKQAEPAGASGGMGGSGEEPVGEVTSIACESNRECDDGAFCNGVEQCVDGFCHLGVVPECDDGIDCTEDSCSHSSNSCLFVAPDEDGDGHADAGCAGPNGESLGDDCDDGDPNRYPGNTEACTLDDPTHDEDCNPNTVGHLDDDLDGSVSGECCNESDDGLICGEDCDDSNFSMFPDHPEICDNIDNNCDGDVDVNTKEVLWFPDADGDHYGEAGSEGVLDCSPVAGHALRATDCNDSTAAVHAAALEICDGVDNDCDGDVDEDGVCACAPEGNARACACTDGNTGVQACTGGLWGTCDCTECVTGTMDCLGDLLPRICEDGRWVVESACTGVRPICIAGECVCSDGTMNCQEIDDIVPPVIVASSPADNESDFPLDGVLAVVFSEDLMSATVSDLSVRLEDALGNQIHGEVGFGGSSITFTPQDPLPAGLELEWLLEGGISDLAGNTMGGRQTIRFSTEIAMQPVLMGDPPITTYDHMLLAVSRNGTAKISAQRTDGSAGDSFVVDGVAELDFDGTDWIDAGIIHDETDLPRGLTVDDQGWAIATRRAGSTVFKYDLQVASWVWDETPVTIDDMSPSPLVISNAAGDAIIATQDEGNMEATIRSSAGSYNPVVTPAPVSPSYLAGDISESRDAVIVWDQGASLHAWRTLGAMAGWTKASVVDGSVDTIKDAKVMMGENGVATVAWVQRLDNGGGPAFDQIQVQDLDSAASWVGVPEFAGGSWKGHHESAPQIGNDDSGNTHVMYIDNGTAIHWIGREAGMPWSSDGRISLNHEFGVSNLRMEVSANGVAYAIWIDDQVDDLWGCRFNPGLGWEPPQHLEEDNARVTEAQLKVDENGNAHVIYFSSEWYSLQMTAPSP